MRLACIDIDGICANRDARLALARGVYVAKCREEGKEPEPLTYNKGFDWDAFFDPAHVHFDTLIEGVKDALDWFDGSGYTIVFLTSRPEHMREATELWLCQHLIWGACDAPLISQKVYMKDEENRYTKTPQWKADMVKYLVEVYQASEVLLIDDREDNLEHMVKGLTIPFALYTSLADAVKIYQDRAMRYSTGER